MLFQFLSLWRRRTVFIGSFPFYSSRGNCFLALHGALLYHEQRTFATMNVQDEEGGNKYAILFDVDCASHVVSTCGELESRVHTHDTCQKDHGVPNRGSGVGGEWVFWIWYHLLNGPKRFSVLQKHFPKISRQMLTLELRELKQMRVLHRQASAGEPAKGSIRAHRIGTELRADSAPALCLGQVAL